MSLRNNFTGGLLIGLLVGAAIGAGAMWFVFPPGSISTGTATITTAGSSTVFPLSEVWAEEYNGLYSNTTVQVAGGGSGYGQTSVGTGDIDIGGSSSPIKTANFVTYPGLKQIPVALDGLAVIFNTDVNGTGMQKLTREAVIEIFQGNITTWEALESAYGVSVSATGTIKVYVRSDASGTTDTFSRWLKTNDSLWLRGSGEEITWGSHATAVNGNPGVATAVGIDSSGIGYVGLAFANETENTDIKQVALLNPTTGEYVLPSYDTVKLTVPTTITDSSVSLFNANITGAYPIARMLFYILNNETVTYQPIKFIRWCISDGQIHVRGVGFVEISGTAIPAFSASILDDLLALV